MKPIAQNFTISEPTSGVETVYLTSAEVYFRLKSSTYGVEVQIRTTQGGVPTQYILPFGSAVLYANNTNLKTSADSSVATKFTFDTPVALKTNEQYSLVVSPLGGDPNYDVWTAKLGQNDLITKSPIFKNNQIGSMYLGTNDLDFTPVQDEVLKYKLYVADFTSSSGDAVFTNSNTDYFVVGSVVGTFQPGEHVVMSNNELRRAVITVGSTTNFSNGNLVYQPDTAASYLVANAYGTIVDVRGSNLVLKEVYGTFVGAANTIQNANNANTTTVSGVVQNVTTSISSNTITVPDANTTTVPAFASNNYIYVANQTRANLQVVQVVSANAANSTITVNPAINFATSDAIIGAVKANANLYGFYSTQTAGEGGSLLILDNVNSNVTQNFANSSGNYLIGMSSGASAIIYNVYDLYYDSVTTQFSFSSPKDTDVSWSFTGTSANGTLVDTSYFNVVSDIPNEFVDKKRVILSRSNEFANPVSNSSGPMTAGTKSLKIKASISSANAKISPFIDTIKSSATLTQNKVRTSATLNGILINIANTNGAFVPGAFIWQSNTTANTFATILFSNSSSVVVSNVQSDNTSHYATFLANGTSIVTSGAVGSNTANVTAVQTYDEETDSSLEGSRYISKNVILAEGQDAEDIVTFLTAYRPPNTNFRVYAKLLAADDNDPFDSKVWSYMPETSSPALLSSIVNRDDFVELQYDLPVSVQKAPNGSITNSNTTVTLPTFISTGEFKPGQFIYLSDAANKNFNVRQIVGIPDNSTIITSSNVSFTSSNVSIGLISDLTSQYSAFKYGENNNVVRYVTPNDGVFDSYKTFAVKLVFLSDDTPVVPRIADVRTIALQV